MRGSRIAHHSAPLGADQSARGRDRAERRSFIRDGAGHCRWEMKMSIRSSPQRSMRPCDRSGLTVETLLDEVNGARPGLIAVRLRHAHIDRKVRPSRKAYRVDERDVSGPVVLRQAVDAQPSTKTAAFELNEVVPQRREFDIARLTLPSYHKPATRPAIAPP